jgi:PAS domain S-box-containing protein
LEDLCTLLIKNKDWLIYRIIIYVKKYGYDKYTSTLTEEDWHISVSGFSDSIIKATDMPEKLSDLYPDEDYSKDSTVSFGLMEAKKYYSRGITLPLFLVLMKYYRKSYIDLTEEFCHEKKEKYKQFIERFFDRIELASSTEWSKTSEKELRRLAIVIENASESIIITDNNGNIQYINPAFEKITGYNKEEVKGKNPGILKSGKHDRIFYRELWDTITEGNVWKGNIINKKKNGTLYESEASISPINDDTGKITNYVMVKRDITQEKRLENQLRQAQKMEAIGNLAGGIAHDFNNILGAIIGFTEITLAEFPDNNLIQKNLQTVLKAGNRAKELIEQILTFSRHTENRRSLIRISTVIKEAVKLMRASIPTTIEIRQNIKAETSVILADPTQIHQILINLCTNAAYAMKENGGIMEISLENFDFDGKDMEIYNGLKPGPYVKLTVKDTGRGMEKKIVDRIFEPYFTTKKPGEGTGMGLAVVHGIIKSHGGEIVVDTRPGIGTVFNIYLKRIKSEVKEEIIQEEKPPIGTEKILMVDDEQDLVSTNEYILKLLGYKVITTSSSIEALEIFREKPCNIDLVITDQTMPGMTGLQLTKEMLKIRSDMPVILCTGFVENIENIISSGIKALIKKPVTMMELAKTVRKVLDKK